VTFREAHGIVGRLVREAEHRECELHELPLTSYQQAHAAFDAGVFEVLSAWSSVERRHVEGGTAPEALRTQLDAARTSLRAPSDIARGGNDVELWMR
jgi:argininosuccinate lyase